MLNSISALNSACTSNSARSGGIEIGAVQWGIPPEHVMAPPVLHTLHFTFRALTTLYPGVPVGYRFRRAWRSAVRTVSPEHAESEGPLPFCPLFSPRIGAGTPFTVQWRFLNPAPGEMEAWISAASLLAREGIGARREHGSGKISLLEVTHGPNHHRVWEPGRQEVHLPAGEALYLREAPPTRGYLRIRMRSPLHLRRKGTFMSAPTLPEVVRAAAMRTQHVLGEASLNPETLHAAARALHPVDVHWVRHDAFVQPTPHTSPVPLPGVLGHLTAHGEIGALVPLLELAAKLHIGSHKNFGLGLFEVDIL